MTRKTSNFASFDESYDEYEAQFDPLKTDRQARRKRKLKVSHRPKKAQQEIAAEIGDGSDNVADFQMTYQPSRYEEGYLLDSLRVFFGQQLITDVLAQVKGGKEASVYRCEAHANTGYTLLAAKVYRPRMFRQLRNDAMYREGRSVLTEDGRAVKATDTRIMRALGKKTDYGAQVAHTSWLMHEFNTLQQLYNAGAAVPRPILAGENAILMTYIGDAGIAAPALNDVDLDTDEAQTLFAEVMRNIELMLSLDMIHGDLSAYNILYWEGEVTLIDFPQVTNPHGNTNARAILQRDITRVCDYFSRFGVKANPAALTRMLWDKHVKTGAAEFIAESLRLQDEG